MPKLICKKRRTKGPKCKNENLTQKWVFGSQTWPKDRELDLRPNLVSFGGEQNHRERREKGRRRRRGIGRGEEEKPSKKVWKLTLSMDFYDFWYGFYMESKDIMVLYGVLGIFMSPKPRVC